MTTSAPKLSAEHREKLQHALRDHPPRRKYLVGVSGGRDSMVLLHGLHALGYRHLIVCHLDHGLRGAASRADGRLVSKEAGHMQLAFEGGRADTRKTAREGGMSLELAARNLRHEFFRACARKYRCHRLFLAHHADDQEETVLFNFLRGSGAAGLGGMHVVSTRKGLTIIRPFLEMTRLEIDAIARETCVRFREDASNLDPTHSRNRLRHEVLPTIHKAMGEASQAAILRAAEILREENAWMESLLPPFQKRLPCRSLREMPLALRRRVVLRWLQRLKVPEAGFAETTRVLTLLNDGTGPARASLPGGTEARRRAGEIFLEKPRK